MEDYGWQTVLKPKKSKSGEIHAKIEENIDKILIGNRPNIVPKRKTQIPVKIKETKKSQPLKFKTLSIALQNLNLSELRKLLSDVSEISNDVMNLKTVFTFLNERLRLEHSGDSFLFDRNLDYPDCILPKPLKFLLQDLIKKSSTTNLEYFFQNLLQSLCEELNKSRSFIGHLILLQQISKHHPSAATTNLASTCILRNSYMNQPSICFSLFWALGTSGLVDTSIAIKVWIDIISPSVQIKSYAKFAFSLLHKILCKSDRTPNLNISIDNYRTLINILLEDGSKTQLKDLQIIKTESLKILINKKISNSNEIEAVFLLLLKFSRQTQTTNIFCSGIWKCVTLYPKQCMNIWRMNFNTYQRQNVNVFRYLEDNLEVAEEVFNHPEFMNFVKQIDFTSYPNLNFLKDIPAKMTDNKKQKKQKKANGSGGSSCCRWLFGSFLLFGAIAGLITYDTQVLHGGKFEESSVGRVLKQTGALPHVENAWFVSLKYSAKGYKFAEEQAPVAYGKTRTFLQPFCEFAKDLGLTALNGGKKGWESTKVFAAEKTPVVVNFIDNYVPGLGKNIQSFIEKAMSGFCNLTCGTWKSSVEFFKSKVFIGQLSPENLGKALNSTAERALTYYSWFHEKVDFYAKVK